MPLQFLNHTANKSHPCELTQREGKGN
jgi:hypothetical protein